MRSLIILSIFLLVGSVASSQNVATTAAPATEQIVSMPKTDWLQPFNGVKIDGPMNVVMKRVATAEESKITYDTKGNITSKFKFELDKNGLLTVSERVDPKRISVTDVTIYYHSLKEVKVARAQVEFENDIESKIFDLLVSSGATVSLELNAFDVAAECTGTSRLTLKGNTKYLTMRASTAKVDASNFSTVSATIDVSHSAEVRLVVSERLECTTSTGAKLLYKGHPEVVRDHSMIFGGDIINVN